MITKISIVYAPVPYIVLETDNVITANGTQQQEIDFNELSAYINILTQQQTALGQYVNFYKGVYTVNNRNFDAILIVPSLNPEPGTGAPMIAQLSNAPANACAVNPSIIYATHSNPIVVGDFLFSDNLLAVPLVGFDQVVDATTGLIYSVDTLTGEVLAATGGSCTVPPPVVPIPLTVTFKINGVDFDATNQMTIDTNVTSITADKTANAIGAPFNVNFVLPRRGGATFYEDYDEPAQVYTQARIGTGLLTGFWVCNATYQYQGIAVDTVDYVDSANDFIEVTQINNPSAQSLEFAFWKNAFDVLYNVGYVGAPNATIFITRDTEIYPQAYAQASKAGVYDVNKYDANGVVLETQYNVSSSGSTVTIPANCVKLEFVYKSLTFINNIAGSANKILVTDSSISGFAFGLIYDESNTAQVLRYPKGIGFPAGNLGIATIDAALLPYDVKFYKLGVLITTHNVTTQLENANCNDEWDTLVFGTATPPSPGLIAVNNQMGAAPGETSMIAAIAVDSFPVGSITFPVPPLGIDNGTTVGGAAVDVDVTITATGVVPPTTIRVTDALGVDHDLPYTTDTVYNFPALNCDGLITVTLF